MVAYDPYVTSEEARVLGVDLMSLEDLYASWEVVSLHAPLLPETEGMILGSHLASMKRNAALINTSRGAVVRGRDGRGSGGAARPVGCPRRHEP